MSNIQARVACAKRQLRKDIKILGAEDATAIAARPLSPNRTVHTAAIGLNCVSESQPERTISIQRRRIVIAP
jgi:hypothetical protein